MMDSKVNNNTSHQLSHACAHMLSLHMSPVEAHSHTALQVYIVIGACSKVRDGSYSSKVV